jgi:hypothetical protein
MDGGNMRGQRHSRGGLLILGAGRIFGRLGDCIGAFSRGGIGKLYFWFWLEEFVGLLQGSIGCWEFWARGQESLRNPGAREPDRLCS